MKSVLMILACGLAASAWAVDPVPEIVNARTEFLDNAPTIVDTPEPQDLESFLLSRPAGSTLALIEQVEGSGNRVEVNQQDGSSDIAAVFQGFGDNNLATVTQAGTNNFAVLSQTGSGNQVMPLEQLGNDNVARLVQFGDTNIAQVNQINDSNELNLQQTDGFNNALVNQYGNAVLDITQNNPGGSAAAINALTVSATVEPGYVSNFGPISLSGAGQTDITLCTGGPSFCTVP